MPRMVCIGPGPGPKNVLVEFEDGSRTVVPYAIWKHKLSKQTQGEQLADKVYRTVIGIVQFDPKEGEAAGKPVRNIVIRQVGFKEQSTNVYITVWPSHEDVPIKRGDALLVEGTFTQGKGTNQETGETKTYNNISATRIVPLGAAVEGKRTEVESDDEPVNDDDIPF